MNHSTLQATEIDTKGLYTLMNETTNVIMMVALHVLKHKQN